MTTSLAAVGATEFRNTICGSRLANGCRLPARDSLRSRLVFRRRTRPGFSGCWKGLGADSPGSMVPWKIKTG
ncbi:hypothetical protein K5549_015779 [Capra hircus]|uniref:Uncharacterized protein n=1 Tax=Capra hircus TaxID=9925 RepID=A0A452DV70_CAPHI|nr:hypothetical protein K5549_015779 [Capra hircus]